METELKLLIDPADVRAFARLALLGELALDKPRRQRLTSVYFDTPDLHLKRHGLGLRVRRVARAWVQTLKSDGSVAAGLHQREEWETRVGGACPELGALIALLGQASPWARPLAAPGLAQQLVPIFTTRVRRTLRQLRLPAGQQVELALDQGELKCGEIAQTISEVELELKSGAAAGLFDLASHLMDGVPLRLGNVSKSERGYALCAASPPRVVKAMTLDLSRRMRVEQGLQAIVANCLAQIQGNEAGVMQGSELESVHQMRVGLRRLRCALRLFAPFVVLPEAQQAELEWLAGELGAARDWEVLAADTLAEVIGAGPVQAGMAELQQAALAAAEQNRRAAAAAVGATRYARLLLFLVGWSQAARWHESLHGAGRRALREPLGGWTAKLLARCHARLLARGRRLQHATPAQRHRLRIAAKTLRYAMEFFRSLYPSRRVARFLADLARLQDSLGWLNDAAVADALLRRLADDQPSLARPASLATDWLAGRTEAQLRTLRKLWKRFARIRPPWEQ